MNVDDAEVRRLLNLYTFVPDEQIASLTAVEGDALREAKQVLAFETTRLAHGSVAAEEAESAARALFAGQSIQEMLADPNIPTAELSADLVASGMSLAEAFVQAGLVSSRGEARRLAAQGGLSVDGERVEDVDRAFQAANNATLFRVGKKRFRRVLVS